MRPAVAILATIVAPLIAMPAGARDLFVDDLRGYTIEADILDAPNCDGPAFDDVTLREFEQALCVFHRPARSADDTERTIDLLDRAQTRGMPPVSQSLAGLLTGLAHCDHAERHLDAFRASGEQDRMARTLFCRERRFASAELGAVRWDHALFEYAEGLGAGRTLDARLTEMSACYAGVLDASFDAECGLISNISETEINAFVDEAVDEVIVKYFAGVESPITAMFARKLQRAEGLKDSAAAAIADLRSAAEAVNAAYDTLNAAYEGARDDKMAPIYDAYRDAILRATAILDEFDRWKGGLFITSENVNLMPQIAERATEIGEELARAEGLAFRETAEQLVASVRQVVNSDTENRATVAALCRIYFCELANRRSIATTIRACRRPSLSDNPLCIGQDGMIKSGVLAVDFDGPRSVDVVDLCRSAGVDPAFAVLNMGPTTAATCLAHLP